MKKTLWGGILLAQASAALAAEPAKIDAANTAWMLTAAVLVQASERAHEVRAAKVSVM